MAKPFRVFQVGELLKFGQIDIYAGSQTPLFFKGWFTRFPVPILDDSRDSGINYPNHPGIQVSTILVIIGPVSMILGNSTDDEVAVHPKWRCKSKGSQILSATMSMMDHTALGVWSSTSNTLSSSLISNLIWKVGPG